MPIHDDGDEVRGLGFVALYTAYLEEQIDACLDALASIDQTTAKRMASKPVSVKIKLCIDLLSSLKSDALEVTQLLDARNDVVHGRIYGQAGGAIFQSYVEPGVKARVSKS